MCVCVRVRVEEWQLNSNGSLIREMGMDLGSTNRNVDGSEKTWEAEMLYIPKYFRKSPM